MMGGYYINLSVQTTDAARVRSAVVDVFGSEGFRLLSDEAASAALQGEPDDTGEDGYGALVSGPSGRGWVTVYVDDWADSGLLAKRLSQTLAAPVLEVWVAEDIHWGYNSFAGGEVRDRFADDPAPVAESDAEAAQYQGQPDTLAALLHVPPAPLHAALTGARQHAGQFAAPGVDALAAAVGLPFEHVFTGYDYFWSDDPDEYADDLENWPAFRLLTFQPPAGRDTLTPDILTPDT